jgi:hypothetical protein
MSDERLGHIVLELALRALPGSADRARPDVLALLTSYMGREERPVQEAFLDLVVEILEDPERSVGVLVAVVELVGFLIDRLAEELGEEPTELVQRLALSSGGDSNSAGSP